MGDAAAPDRALAAAEAYVACIDRRHQMELDDWLVAVHRELAAFYAAILRIDWDDAGTEDDHESSFSDAAWNVLYDDLGQLLGPINFAREVFDPYGPPDDEPVIDSVADALADVYREAMNALNIARHARIDAGNELLLGFEIHSGHHAVDALRALHAHRFTWRENGDPGPVTSQQGG
jgi:hypothetical protein